MTAQRPGAKASRAIRADRPARHAPVAVAELDIIERDYVYATRVQRLRQRLHEAIRRLARRRTDVARVVILRDPEVLGGKAVIGGTRVPIWVIEDIYRGEGFEGVLEDYPELTDEEVMAALLYARHSGRRGVQRDRQAYHDAIPEHLRD